MKNLIGILASSIVFFSCSSVQKTSTAKSMNIYGMGVMHIPVLADLEVSETKITGTKTGSSTSSLDELKAEAIAAALKTSNADVLIEPAFQIETDRSRITVVVTGRPATYKNFRKMELSDTLLIQAGILQKPLVIDPAPAKKKKKGAAVLAGVGTAALITTGAMLAADAY